MSYLEWPISQIATELPGATAILFQHKINFCCHGEKLLSDVLRQKQLDENEFVQALEALEHRDDSPGWEDLNDQELIARILTRFHEVHRQQLDELIRLSQRVETVHADHPLCPTGLAAHLLQVQQELEQHMQKEESILFPMMSSGANPMVMGPISVMRSEHEEHLLNIEKIYQLSHDVTPHPDACNTWQALYLGLQEFISDINMHIHVENNILFKRANVH